MFPLATMFVLVICPYIASAQDKSSKVFLYTVTDDTFGIYALTFTSFNNVDKWINCICGNNPSCTASPVQLSSETPSVQQSEPDDCNLIDFKGDNVTYLAQTPVACLRNHTQKVIPHQKLAVCNPQCVILVWFADGDRSSFNPLSYCKSAQNMKTSLPAYTAKSLTEPIYVTTPKTRTEPIYVTTTQATTSAISTVENNSKTELIVAVILSVGCTILVVFAVIIIIVCVKRKRRGRTISSKTSYAVKRGTEISETEKISPEGQYSSLDANYSSGHTYAGVTTTPVYYNASDVTKFKNTNPSPKGKQQNEQTRPKMLLRDESIASEVSSHAYISPVTSGYYTNLYDGIDEGQRDSQGVYSNTEPAAFYYSQAGGTKGQGHEYLSILPPIDDYTEVNTA
ncbi:uncharacterized protein LOC131946711 [Physella acuta]|uniref:uncharacterized protein LOC131946711 n=1 Tax=Physella acuta TaxID=109671 RepID=UPI0027DBC39B|nr:uncharacterized protein LOC131946711 [Physella acuta]